MKSDKLTHVHVYVGGDWNEGKGRREECVQLEFTFCGGYYGNPSPDKGGNSEATLAATQVIPGESE